MPVGDLSTLLVWAAATAFTIALFAYSVDLARIADAAARPRQAARAAKVSAAAKANANAANPHAATARVPALAGAPSSPASPSPLSSPHPATSSPHPATSETSGVLTREVSDVAVTPDAASERFGVLTREVSDVAARTVGGGVPAAPLDELARESGDVPGRSAKAEGIARSTHWLGILLLLVGIVLRGVAAGRWPTANMYEFTLVGVLVATTVLAVVQRRRVIAFVGVVVSAIAVLALVLALNAFFVRADAVGPALQSYWLVIHVGVAISATGVFTVAFGTSVLQLLSAARAENRSHLAAPWSHADGLRRPLAGWRVTGPRFAWLRQVPDALHLEALSFRLNAVGFVLWTFTLIAGSIWAEHAWGRYWNWDPKEVGTFVAWVVYAAYLHARTTRGWSGRRAAYLVFAGYLVVLANFTVVNLFVSGLHSYSGLR